MVLLTTNCKSAALTKLTWQTLWLHVKMNYRKDSDLEGCGAVSSSPTMWTAWPLKMKALWSFQTSGILPQHHTTPYPWTHECSANPLSVSPISQTRITIIYNNDKHQNYTSCPLHNVEQVQPLTHNANTAFLNTKHIHFVLAHMVLHSSVVDSIQNTINFQPNLEI